MLRQIYAETTTSISELKKNPMGVVNEGHGETVAVLNRNQPAFYCVPAAAYEQMMAIIDNAVKDNPELSPEFIEEALEAKQDIESGNVEPYTVG